MTAATADLFKGRHFDQQVILRLDWTQQSPQVEHTTALRRPQSVLPVRVARIVSAVTFVFAVRIALVTRIRIAFIARVGIPLIARIVIAGILRTLLTQILSIAVAHRLALMHSTSQRLRVQEQSGRILLIVSLHSRLLDQAREGDKYALDSLLAAVYGELRRIAASLMRGQLHGRTLQPTALVNEAWLRMASGKNQWENKAHFFGTAARAMRQVLTEEARRRSSQKRAGDAKRVTFRDLDIESEEPAIDLLALDQALKALAKVDERYIRLIDLRYFAGCSLEEVAELTGRSLASVKRDWTYARAWLFERMSNPAAT